MDRGGRNRAVYGRTLPFLRHNLCAWLCACVLLAGCVSNPVSPVVAPTCISPTYPANVYSTHSNDAAVGIYAEYYQHLWDADPYHRDYARQKAFVQLGRLAEHWSYYVDIPVKNTQPIRITITYLDPVLLHHIVLNNAFSNGLTIDVPDFESQLQEVMTRPSGSDELLFGVTISAYNQQASNGGLLTVRLPIREMKLMNSTGSQVYPFHVDPVLTEYIPITRTPVFGLVGYPIDVLYQGDGCIWNIDPLNTMLVLETPYVSVGATQIPTQFWSIPYRSSIFNDLELPVLSVNPPAYVYENNYDWGRVSRLSMPPIPNWQPDTGFDNTDWKRYWEDMGRYLWYQLLPENEP